jgi:hypothetical protein
VESPGFDAAIGIGTLVVERLTSRAVVPPDKGRAEAGMVDSGSPIRWRPAPASEAVDARGGGSATGADACRLTVGNASGTSAGTRRIPPVAGTRAGTGDAPGATAATARAGEAAARWTAAGRAALAADVSGRSGIRIVSLETVGRLRMGAGTGIGAAASAPGDAS